MCIIVFAVCLHDDDDDDDDNDNNIIIIKPMFLRQARCNITDYCNGYLDCLVRTANW